MSSKTIRLDEEAYTRLKRRKRAGESFSDVVKRLAGEQSFLDVTGIWAEDTDDIREAILAHRTRREAALDDIADRHA